MIVNLGPGNNPTSEILNNPDLLKISFSWVDPGGGAVRGLLS